MDFYRFVFEEWNEDEISRVSVKLKITYYNRKL